MSQITDSRLPLDPVQEGVLTNLVNLADSGPCEWVAKVGGVFVNVPIGGCAVGGSPTNGLQLISSSIGLGGLLTQDTVIDGDSTYVLQFSNIIHGGFMTNTGNEVYATQTSAYILSGDNSVIVTNAGVFVVTPTINSATAQIGQVLTLQNDATGEVEYAWVQAVDVEYDNSISGLAATNLQDAVDEVDAQVDTNTSNIATLTSIIGGLPPVVSSDAGNDITTGTDGGAFFQETITTVSNTVSGHKIADYTNENTVVVPINETITSLSNLSGSSITYTKEDGTTNVVDLAGLSASLDWSTVDWNDFFTNLDWTQNDWASFFTEFYGNIVWDDFLAEIITNWTATNWNTFIDEFIVNVDNDDVINFLNQNPGTNDNDVLLWDADTNTWVVGEIPLVPSGIRASAGKSFSVGATNTTITASKSFEDVNNIYTATVATSNNSSTIYIYNRDVNTGEPIFYTSHTVTGTGGSVLYMSVPCQSDTDIFNLYRATGVYSVYRTDKATLTTTQLTLSGVASPSAIPPFYHNGLLYIYDSGLAEYVGCTVGVSTVTATATTVPITGASNLQIHSVNGFLYGISGLTTTINKYNATTGALISTTDYGVSPTIGHTQSISGLSFDDGSVYNVHYLTSFAFPASSTDLHYSILIKTYSVI